MVAPSHVRGPDANPVFRQLAEETQAPSWNFNKYLVDGSGRVVAHFGSSTSPDNAKLRDAIERVF
jgi:glutathione peroxidase